MLHEGALMDWEKGGPSSSTMAPSATTTPVSLTSWAPIRLRLNGDFTVAKAMSRFFDKLDTTTAGKTIIYNLNPRDNDMIAP